MLWVFKPVNKKIVLHIGAHRTATTRAQNILRHHQKNGAIQGLYFAGPNVIRPVLVRYFSVLDYVPAAHHLAGSYILKLMPQDIQKGILDINSKAIISDENILGELDESILRGKGLYPSAKARLHAIRKILPESDIEPIIGIRSYSDWFASSYAIVYRRRNLPEHKVLAEKWAKLPRRWSHVVNDVISIFGTCKIVQFSEHKKDPNLFIRAVLDGRDLPAVNDDKTVMGSPSEAAIKELHIKRRNGEALTKLDVEAVIQRHASKPAIQPFSSSQIAELNELYDDDMKKIRTLRGATFLEA